eukprot:CAMPEP_0172498202 /NCGR_PEP_ID=MMETSP1066-20121228/110695_1 /TAXON_ID=671091 /ORGANISM="Coscinodiscus wailesii, Strain CCMP2513" /LENGTH=174 /DNA_ID=CAMNT_0013271393 /DNA_START=153 /DNA_END=677 /DNA_ORIENTATION=+
MTKFFNRKVRDSIARRYLTPSQGRQLAAYYNAKNLVKNKGEDSAATNGEAETLPPLPSSDNSELETSIARQFINKIFQLPSLLMRNESDYKAHEYVLQPIIGFRWVAVESEDGETTYQVLPPMGKCACSLLPKENEEEEVYGWFSPGCRLGNVHSYDDDTYCGEAVQSGAIKGP